MRSVALLSVFLAFASGGALCQPTRADSSSLVSRSDVFVAGSLLAAQIALFAFDDDLHRAATAARSRATDDVSDLLRPLGRKPPWLVASAAAYVIGHVAGAPRVADAGLHALVSVALASAVTGGLKGLAGRARPVVLRLDGVDSLWVGRQAHEWSLLAGWQEGGPRQSWPSGHTTAAFAVAAVLTEELGGPTGWIAYPIATGVAWSRVNDAAHWATDVLMGALVGTFTARLVVRYGHSRGGWLERTLLFESGPVPGAHYVGARVSLGRP